MKITELAHTCQTTRKKVLKKLNFIISTVLFNTLLNDEDEIPEIGISKLKKKKDIFYLEIQLEDKWQKLLSSDTDIEGVTEILTNCIKEQVGS